MPLDSTLTILELTCRRMARSFPLRGCFEGRQESNRLCGTFINCSNNYYIFNSRSLSPLELWPHFEMLANHFALKQVHFKHTFGGMISTFSVQYFTHPSILCPRSINGASAIKSSRVWSCTNMIQALTTTTTPHGLEKPIVDTQTEKSTPVTSVSSSRVSKTRSRPLSSGDSLTTHKRWTLRTQTSPTGTLFILSEWKWKSFESRFSSSHFLRLEELVAGARAQL